MRSKACHAFQQKLNYFNDDIELIDVLRVGVTKDDLTDPGSNKVLKHINPDRHKHLSRRRNSSGSRELIINHLRTTLYSSFVKDVYEEVTIYIRTILEQAARNGFAAGRIIGEHSFKMDAKAVLEAGSWENVANLIADSLFQNLESEKSTLKLLKKFSSKLALNVDEALIEDVLPYLEVRHYLVHTDGKLSEEFKSKYPFVPRNNNGQVKLTYRFICDLRDKAISLISACDQAIITSDLLDKNDTQP